MKIIIGLTLIVLSIGTTLANPIDSIVDMFLSRPQYAVETQHVLQATCRRQEWPSEEEMIAYLQSKKFYPRNPSDYFKGMRLLDESQYLADLFHQLTMSQFRINSDCNDVICATKYFFRSRGVFYLYVLARYGLNMAPTSISDPVASWKNSEIELVKRAILRVGSALEVNHQDIEREKNQRFKFLVGYDPGKLARPGTYAGVDPRYRTLSVYGLWRGSRSDYTRVYHLVHEFGHVIDLRNGYSRNKQWRDISGWVEMMANKWEYKTKKQIVSNYGTTNAYEDFAESFAAYRLNPAHLEKISSTKYQIMKHAVFDGVEFGNESECRADTYIERASRRTKSDSEIERLYGNECSRNSYYVMNDRSDELIEACLNYKVQKHTELRERDFLRLVPRAYQTLAKKKL